MDEKIWIGREGQKYGPYDEAVLRRWVQEGKVEAGVLAWRTGMTDWVPLASLLPGMDVPPPPPPRGPDAWGAGGFSARGDDYRPPDPRTTLDKPPSLNWFVVFLLAMITGGIFGWIWLFVQAAWVKKIDRQSKAIPCFIGGLVSYVAGAVLSRNHTLPTLGAALLVYIGAVILLYVGIYAMADSIRRDAAQRGLKLRIGGITLFFLNVYYLQSILTWLAHWKETGKTEPAPSKALVWVVIFVPITAIVAAIAIPQYQNYIIRAEVAQGIALTAPAKSAVLAYYNSHGQMPHDNAQAGLADAAVPQGRFVSGLSVDDGRITVTFGGGAHRQVAGGAVTLTPTVGQGQMSFSCSANAIPASYLPQACR